MSVRVKKELKHSNKVVFRLKMVGFKRNRLPQNVPKNEEEKRNCCCLINFSSKL